MTGVVFVIPVPALLFVMDHTYRLYQCHQAEVPQGKNKSQEVSIDDRRKKNSRGTRHWFSN